MKKIKQIIMIFSSRQYLRPCLFALMCVLFHSLSAQIKITGTVLDDLNTPLPGVIVFVKGTSNGTLTDFDGLYSIDVAKGDTLTFTYEGMNTITVVVGDKDIVNIVMEYNNETLDEIVVIGYGTSKKSDLISSVASVKVEEMLEVATSDIGEMIRGKAAGVQVTLDDGGPGSSSSILIRGKSSISGGTDPIVIADGVPIGNINDINPNDIESLEILKDAAAQAIYGARASNGVILITTKRGADGKTKISYNGSSGVQLINRNFDIYSGDEFAALKREANRNANGGVAQPDENIFSPLELASIQSGEYIDWEEEIIGVGTTQNHSLSISSGTENTSVYTSLNYFNQEGVIKNSDYKRITARLNVDQKLNDWLKIGMNTSFQFSEGNRPNVGDIILSSITTSPLGQIFNEDGTLRLEPGGFEENKNPLINLNETTTEDKRTNNLINIFLDITPFKGFKYRLNASRRSWDQKVLSYNSTQSVVGIASGELANGSVEFEDEQEWQIENVFTFNTDFNTESKHNLDLTAVQSISEKDNYGYFNFSDGIPDDIRGINGLEKAQTQTSSVSGFKRGLLSFAGRAEYGFNSKYYATVSGRVDGSTVFGVNNKWAVFPAAALGWNVHKESFIIDNVNVINNLKLRLSYGSVGNEGADPYQSIASAASRDYIIDGVKVSGYVGDTFLSNPNLKWETSTTLNAAIDIGLWKNRITSTIEYYDTSTKDLLVVRSLPADSGFSFMWTNIGEVQNKGIEFSLNSEIIRSEDLNVNLGLIFSKNTNKIISLYGTDADGDGVEDDDVRNGWFIGQSIDVYNRNQAVGIFQEGEDIINTHQPNAQPGDVKLFDRDPTDGILNQDDRVVTNRTPDWTGSLNLSADYKGIDFSTNVTTVQGIVRDNAFLYGFSEGGSLRGIKNGISQNYWTPENPGGDFPRPSESDDPTQLIALGVQDASYVRLQNVTFGYSLSKETLAALGLNKLRFYVTGSNLLTITDFESFSPEKEPSEYPEAVSVVMGLQVNF